MKRIRGIGSAASAIAGGLLVLAGYLFGHNAADGTLSLLGQVQLFILNVGVVLAGFAVLIGVFNLCIVHFNKIRHKQKGSFYSAILIIAMLGTFALGLISHYVSALTTLFNDTFSAIILPVETSLMAILAVTLTYASIRLLRRRLNMLSVIFLLTALIILFCTVPLPLIGLDTPKIFGDVRRFIVEVMAASGARGILIGVALGTLTVGLRIIFGADRPYGGEK
jgi:hypothetical protein